MPPLIRRRCRAAIRYAIVFAAMTLFQRRCFATRRCAAMQYAMRLPHADAYAMPLRWRRHAMMLLLMLMLLRLFLLRCRLIRRCQP